MTKLKPEPFITNCGVCGIELRLAKDALEGMKAICGKCWPKFKEKKKK